MKAPFPWFGGKRTVAAGVWARFGEVRNYVEPFFGSGAVLLNRPGWQPGTAWIETVNDRDGFIANFWRATQHDPDAVAHWANWPVNENDLHARHVWLRGQRAALTRRLEGDPDYYDAKLAGWWVWGICCWIGGGWCDPETVGPWQVVEDDEGHSQLVRVEDGQGVQRIRVHLSGQGGGVGVHRKRVHLGGQGGGVGVHRHSLRGDGSGGLQQWMHDLAARLEHVRVASGDWSRVCGPSVTFKHGLTGVFLDPPYSLEERDSGLYSSESEHADVAAECREWAIANGDNPLMRIALCGYDTEHAMPPDWSVFSWTAHGGYAGQGNGRGAQNRSREVIWFSPHCVPQNQQLSLL
jgi:hypothetical protein